MNGSEINDKRKSNDFKSITFSGFSKSKVKIELFKVLNNCEIEPSCYWIAELICAGHYNDVWHIIILYYSKYIHIANPKLSIYLSKRFDKFKNIVNSGFNNNELSMRNNYNIRKLFAEIVCIICYSKKGHIIENYSIKTDNDFDIINITNRLKAPTIEYANKIFQKNDPKEIFIAINEFMYNIDNNIKDTISSYYWLEWILRFEIRQKILLCERRTFSNVHEKYQKNIIWIIWECILFISKDKQSNIIIHSLLDLFCIKYTPACNRTRKYIIYNAISFITQSYNSDSKLINNYETVKSITNNIHLIYKEIKNNELAPETDYLFNGLKENNIEKSIQKLEKMNLLLS
tara:strand:+ start:315 stop:1352 length:1038 start_codon:yes stop_codon:yes gene_type:complete